MTHNDYEKSANLAMRIMSNEAIAMESMVSSFTKNFFAVKDYFASSFGFCDMKMTHTDQAKLTSEQKEVVLKLGKCNYLEFSTKTEIAVIPNLSATVAELQPNVRAAIDIIKAFKESVVDPYYSTLSIFISDKNSRTSVLGNKHIYIRLERERRKVADHNATLFSRHNGNGVVKLIDLIPRASDYQGVFHDKNILFKEFESINFKAIKATLDNCATALDMILEAMDAGETEISKEMAETLAMGAYEIAKQGEYMAALGTMCMSYFSIVDNVVACVKEQEKLGKI